MLNQNAPVTLMLPEQMGELEHRAGQSGLGIEKVCGSERVICFAQSCRKTFHQILVDLRMRREAFIKKSLVIKLSRVSFTACAVADLGSPSIMASSPTVAPSPRNPMTSRSPSCRIYTELE